MAATALVCRGGYLVNVFTQSDYAVVPIPFFEEKSERIKYITGLRDKEDQLFAEACNLTRHDLKQETPGLLDIHSFDLTNLHVEAERLESTLIDHIISIGLANIRNKPVLYCPMGIGGHRNHVSVLLAVLKARPRLHELYEICFYEDLHYASWGNNRNAGLSRFLGLIKGERLTRKALVLAPELFARKMNLVGIYFSQHGGNLRAENYVPAATDIGKPHESVWVLSS